MHTIIFAGKDLNLLFFQTLIISPEVPLSRMTKIWVVYPSLIMLSSFLLKKVQKKLNCKKSFVPDFQNLARGLTATAERRVSDSLRQKFFKNNTRFSENLECHGFEKAIEVRETSCFTVCQVPKSTLRAGFEPTREDPK